MKGLCVTVHTSKPSHVAFYYAGVLLLDYDSQTGFVSGRYKTFLAGEEGNLHSLAEHFANYYWEIRLLYYKI